MIEFLLIALFTGISIGIVFYWIPLVTKEIEEIAMLGVDLHDAFQDLNERLASLEKRIVTLEAGVTQIVSDVVPSAIDFVWCEDVDRAYYFEAVATDC